VHRAVMDLPLVSILLVYGSVCATVVGMSWFR
jgi:hypothetical protein